MRSEPGNGSEVDLLLRLTEQQERFWAKVARVGGEDCWPWLGPIRNGSGSFCVTLPPGLRRKQRKVTNYRGAWMLSQATYVPNGFIVRRACATTGCTNPAHLRADRPCAFGTTPEHFWSRVGRSSLTGCWPWLGPDTSDNPARNYGVVGFGGRRMPAHRVAFFLAHGRHATGEVRHRCDNPRCVRPDHLVEGSHLDNMRDRDERGRTRKGTGIWQAKLSDDAVREIRQSDLSIGELATLHGVHSTVICRVRNRKAWRHVS